MTATATRQRGRRAYTKPDGPSKREQDAEAALAAVVELFESGNLPDRIAQTVIARQTTDAPFGTWSLGNQLLTLLAGTTDARGYRQWQEVNRHVVKGAKAFSILAPRKRTITDTDAATGEESKRTIVHGFTTVSVFRFEDTDGEPLEIPDYAPPETSPLMAAAERLGVDVRYAPFVASFRGFYVPSTDAITLCTEDFRTFAHELGHAGHARVLRARGKDLRGGQVDSQEIVAEVVAATLCKLFGVEGYLAHSADYIGAYSKGTNPGRAAMRVLADVSASLAVILDPEPAPAAAPVLARVAA